MSAVASVLELPELLESIMLQLAAMVSEIHEDAEPNTGPVYVLEPITSLLPLHRVDCNFNDVLKGSGKLQRAMFSQSGYMTHQVQFHRLCVRWRNGSISYDGYMAALNKFAPVPRTPLFWLIDKLKLRMLSFNPHQSVAVTLCIDLHPAMSRSRRKVYEEGMALDLTLGVESASWRRIQVFQSEQWWERLGWTEVQLYDPRGLGGLGICYWYLNKLDFADGITLGEVFERIMTIMRRTTKEHLVAEKLYRQG